MTAATFTDSDLPGGYRDAVAMARAAHLMDGDGIAGVWNGTPNKLALLYALSRLPSVFIRTATDPEERDPDDVFESLLEQMPHDLADLEHRRAA